MKSLGTTKFPTRRSLFALLGVNRQHVMQLAHNMHHQSKKNRSYVHQCHLGLSDSNATLGTKQQTFSGSAAVSSDQSAKVGESGA